MTVAHWFELAAGLLMLCACGAPIAVAPLAPSDLSQEAIRLNGNAPPKTPVGACWGHDTIPAMIETVTETVLDQAELRDETGKVIRPASYSSTARQRMVQDRQEVYIRTPCFDQLTPDTVATLQRALKARGYYLLPLTGDLDAPTMTAIRRYQADHGLDTPVLSLKAAETLGLVAVDRNSL